jgi:hypothetical protein
VTSSFTLTVNQTSPSIGTATETATLTGSYGYIVGVGGTTFTIAFASDTFQIGSVTYTLGTSASGVFQPLTSDQLSLTVPIKGHHAPSVTLEAQVSSAQASPLAAAVPEPATVASAFSGALFLAGGWLARRRFGRGRIA